MTVIVNKDGDIKSVFDADCGVKHSVDLLPCVEKLVDETKFDFSTADFLVAVVGAGSFTGIRIGVSTVKGLCFAFNLKVLPITSFDTIAYNVDSGRRLAIIDAGHNGYYVCGYDKNEVCLEPTYILKDQLLELKDQYEFLSSEVIKDIETKVVSIEQGLLKAIELKKQCATFDIESLKPLYVRKSQAEEGRP